MQVQQRLIDEWRTNREKGTSEGSSQEEDDIYGTTTEAPLSDNEDSDTNNDDSKTLNTADGPKQFISHVPVPSQQDIEEAIVRRKKMELLQKYASDSLRAEAEEAKTLLGLQSLHLCTYRHCV